MEAKENSDILAQAKDRLISIATTIELIGSGPSQFLVADNGNRGLEFYAAQGIITVDPAINKVLQGERDFHSLNEALEFASSWLREATKD